MSTDSAMSFSATHSTSYRLSVLAFLMGAGTLAYSIFNVFTVSGTTEESIAMYTPEESVRIIPLTPPTLYDESDQPAVLQKAIASPRIIDALDIEDVVPDEGKLVVANLQDKEMVLYEDGGVYATFPITTFGRPGTAWETPAGLYTIHTKEREHFSSIGHVYMPYSMQFYGNYFIHGRTYYPDGTLTSPTYSGGCIRLETDDAREVYSFADIGTRVFVYDPSEKTHTDPLAVDGGPQGVTAKSYVVADLVTGDVYAERNAQTPLPAVSLAKLMTALVANETISYSRAVVISGEEHESAMDGAVQKRFIIGDLMYPLLMTQDDAVAESLASYLGKELFVRWMNNAAAAFGMQTTVYTDAAGVSDENVSTPDDLYKLAYYIANKKSFIFSITQTDEKIISSVDGVPFTLVNENDPVHQKPFDGGMIVENPEAEHAALSILHVSVAGTERPVVIAILGSEDAREDTKTLAMWIQSNTSGVLTRQSACATCAASPYRRIPQP